MKFTVQVAPEDCTGCGACVRALPGRERDKETKEETGRTAIMMADQIPLREPEAENFDFFLAHPGHGPEHCSTAPRSRAASSAAPLFEFSGACAGCGETPYVKLLTQLFGDRAMIANATGCSSIYGGNLPTTPYCHARRRPRPDLVELAVRGQRRVRLRHAPGRGQVQRLRAGTARQAARRRRATARTLPTRPARGDPRRRPVHAGGHRGAARARGRAQGAPAATATATICAQLALAWPTTWSRSPSGSWAATAGPTTSATAAWTTCWPRAATSTCWCWTPRSTPTPAARLEGDADGRGGQVRRRRQAVDEEGPGHDRHDLRQHLRGHRSPWAPTRTRSVKAFVEAEAYDGPSLIIAYSHCIAHGIDMTQRAGEPEGSGRVRALPAVPLQPGPGRSRARIR